MGGLKKKRRIQIIVLAFLALALATGLAGYAMRDGINYFRTPSQVLSEKPGPHETFRLGGMVKKGSLKHEGDGAVSFVVSDGAASVPVIFHGILPDLFGEGQGMVGTGKFVNGTFEASDILAKHDENYMPKQLADKLKEEGIDPSKSGI